MRSCSSTLTISSSWHSCRMYCRWSKVKSNIGRKRDSHARASSRKRRKVQALKCKLIRHQLTQVPCTLTITLEHNSVARKQASYSSMLQKKWAVTRWAKWSAIKSSGKSSTITWKTSSLKKTWSPSLESVKSLQKSWTFWKSLTPSKEVRLSVKSLTDLTF